MSSSKTAPSPTLCAVKIGLISDIHCNLGGLLGALRELSDCEEILCAGDLLYQYRFPQAVLGLLNERGVRAIVGNHDRTILCTPSHPLRASVDPVALAYLAEIPRMLSLNLDGVRVAVFHGAPWDDPDSTSATYIYPENQDALRRVAQVDADVVVLGHTHRGFAVRVDGTLIVNPGSCGEPRDGTDLLSCAVLDTRDGQVEFSQMAAR